MSTVLTVTYTVLGIVLFEIIIFTFAFLIYMQIKRTYPHKMVIRNITDGKAIVYPNVKWKYHNFKGHGKYIVAKLKQKKWIMPRFPNSVMSPSFGNTLFLDVTMCDDVANANEFRKMTSEEKQKYLNNLGEKIQYLPSNSDYIINPIVHSDRNSIIQNDEIVESLEKTKTPFWQNPQIIAMGIVAIGSMVAIIMIIIGFQFAGDIIATATQVAGTIPTESTNLAQDIANSLNQPPQ